MRSSWGSGRPQVTASCAHAINIGAATRRDAAVAAVGARCCYSSGWPYADVQGVVIAVRREVEASLQQVLDDGSWQVDTVQARVAVRVVEGVGSRSGVEAAISFHVLR